MDILRVEPQQADELTRIAFAAKRYWGYPERWLVQWAPLLTVTSQAIRELDTYVASENGIAVAFYALSYQQPSACLEHFWVDPVYIRRGMGASLFQHALKRCREAGVARLEIESDPNAQGFYERMGAQKVGEHRRQVDDQPRMLPVLEISL